MASARYYVGTSGWVYPHWRKRFYPEKLPQRLWFEHYSKHFDTVEINNTFYRLPAERAVTKWREQAPGGFIYAVKASRYLSHITRLRASREPLARFLETVAPLRAHLGPVLVQLPERFHRDLGRLRRFFKTLPPRPRFVMEFRHESWLVDDVRTLLEHNGVGFCIASDPRRPTAHWATGDLVYVRFHGPANGRYQGSYPDGELREWAGRIEALAPGRTVYMYFNNDVNAHAIRNAQRLRGLLGVPAPPTDGD